MCRIDFDKRDLPMRSDILPIIMIASLGHALAAFVNGEYVGKDHAHSPEPRLSCPKKDAFATNIDMCCAFVGFGHGSNIEKSHVFRKSVVLRPGINNITILAMTVGLPVS